MHWRCPREATQGLGHIGTVTAEHGFVGLTKAQSVLWRAHLSGDFRTLNL